ncbi:Sex peptide receptor [Fragariocoptes setiger]|uniref:Sex peptide receptor n=1 Tax=Fragariocoptes setiger TaxID=1670756 RepID=A0ABQ7S5J6_9ACAR|nr:Sex peptide receptor [Fragariocoptes setiger]
MLQMHRYQTDTVTNGQPQLASNQTSYHASNASPAGMSYQQLTNTSWWAAASALGAMSPAPAASDSNNNAVVAIMPDGRALFAYKDLPKDEQDMIVNITREYPFDYATIMFGYIMPLVLILTIITNTLVVMVLAQRHMRTPTNIVLFAMAIVDLLTLLAPSPWYFYTYTLGYHDKFLYPPGACYIHHIMIDVIPVFFHTSSIWLALLLAGQRYIYVCHPTVACTWCTVPRVKKAIIGILILSFVHQLPRFFDSKFVGVYLLHQDHVQQACRHEISQWVYWFIGPNKYYTTYYGFRILFVNIGPCTALITLNCLLFRALHKAETKRTRLFRPTTAAKAAAAAAAAAEAETTADNTLHVHRARRSESQQIIIAATLSTTSKIKATSNETNHRQCDQDDTSERLLNTQAPNATSSTCTRPHSSRAYDDEHLQQANNRNNNNSDATHKKTAFQKQQSCNNNNNSNSCAISNNKNSKARQSRRTHDSNRTTLMLIVVVTVFLIVEIPVACSTIAHVVLNSFDLFRDVEYHNLNYIKLCTNFLIMLSYPVNFGVYCSMSRKFRQTFKDLFIEGNLVNRRDNSSRYSIGGGAGAGQLCAYPPAVTHNSTAALPVYNTQVNRLYQHQTQPQQQHSQTHLQQQTQTQATQQDEIEL